MNVFPEHASHAFDGAVQDLFASLGKVKSHLHRLIALVQLSLADGSNRTEEAARIDREVNGLEFSIDQQVMRVIAKYAPMLDELRLVLAVSKISASCEHAADMLKNTIKRVGKLGAAEREAEAEALSALLDRVARLFDEALEHFGQLDDAAMMAVLREQQSIHAHYKRSVNDREDSPASVARTLLYRNLDRVADIAYDIAKTGYAARYNRRFVKPKA